MSRVLLTLLIAVLTAVGVALLLLREETHVVSHLLPAAALAAAAAALITWRSTESGGR